MQEITGYFFENGRTWVCWEDSDEPMDFCEEVKITKVIQNILTPEIKVEITFIKGGLSIPIVVPREAIAKDIVKPLVKAGLTLGDTPTNALALGTVLFATEEDPNVVKVYIHEELGFRTDITGKSVFLGVESIGGAFKSRLNRYENMTPQGTVEEWCDALRPYVESTPELQLAMMLSVAAPITAMLQKKGVLENVGIYNLYGNTSTGKTTAMKVMASVWYDCRLGSGIEPINMTANYLDTTVAFYNGAGLFIDDASAAENFDLTSSIYSISSTVSKGRSNGDGSRQERLRFNGAVVFTSERTLVSQTSGQQGIFARVLEFNRPWFKSGEDAEAVAKIVHQYHSTAWEPLMRRLKQEGLSQLSAVYEQEYTALVQQFNPTSGLHRRLLKLCAVLLTAIPHIKVAWKFDVNRTEVMKIISETYQESLPSIPAEYVIHDRLMADIAANKRYFPKKNSVGIFSESAWGEDSTVNGLPCIWVTKKKFVELLEQYGCKDYKVICRLLCDAHLLKQFSGNHFFTPHNIAGIPVQCCALFRKYTMPGAKKKAKPKSPQKATSQILRRNSLLEEENKDENEKMLQNTEE